MQQFTKKSCFKHKFITTVRININSKFQFLTQLCFSDVKISCVVVNDMDVDSWRNWSCVDNNSTAPC
jgi:hypothetical protein